MFGRENVSLLSKGLGCEKVISPSKLRGRQGFFFFTTCERMGFPQVWVKDIIEVLPSSNL
jgi:hypothetical protein